MSSSILLSAGIAPHLLHVPSSSPEYAWKKSSQSIATALLSAGIEPHLIHFPDSAEYAIQQESYWSNSVKSLHPAAILRPQSAQDVSSIVKALVSSNTKFAVRSGGHMQFSGANNIGPEGVTIDLGLMDWTRFHSDDSQEKSVNIGPGGRWGKVFSTLKTLEEGRYVVAGGRDANVGVSGLLLGGGKTYFTAKRGFACDDVVEYEVVLGDGRIVKATAEQNEDLFRGLKGGGNNFGIVTNFRMRAFELGGIWGGMTIYPKQTMYKAAKALVNFTDRFHEDVDSNLLSFVMYSPEFKDVVVASAFVQVGGVENATAYKEWQELPSIMSTCKPTTLLDIATEYSVAPKGFYDTFVTACFKNDERIVAKAAEIHNKLVEELQAFIPEGDFITQCLFQPLPKVVSEHSIAKGGNSLGVERNSTHGLVLVAVGMVKTVEQEVFLAPRMRAWVQGVKDFAATLEDGDGNLPFTYMNYSDKTQSPLAGYGKENVEKLRTVAVKYDPDQVFQKLCPGGFKVSAVKN
ncbi:6-hydroxy-D-nicotine oxidase protein [Podospora fimiseda]|uniref:6-hydroxy-D-nicotine oxidase protein n=1 Tax=Podospora fimiseda TaxID=252190 RepID=A0AAN7BH10_9PEZI|nr:6-hydroxy-D-nicotine oxidase protein [Podospora fimiseda]